MCGIIGGVGVEWDSNPLETISHRGPDFSSFFTNNRVYLGHSRLSILDVSSLGNQPMISSDKNWVIVFNGEIYNHLDVRKNLEDDFNETFISSSDTETLLKGWIRYKKDILNKINGIFSFAIYDVINKKLSLIRDNYGVKPLYFYQNEDQFAFSSELKSFIKLKNFNSKINIKSIVNHCNFHWNPGEETMYKYVNKILPGHLMEIDTEKLVFSSKKYFFPKKIDVRYNENDIIDKLDHYLNKAVERQLLSDVPIGFFLSGGLDSSLLVAIANKKNPKKVLECFTINTKTSGGKEGFTDDLPYARKVAKHLNVNLHEIPVSMPDLSKSFDEMIYCLDEPQADIAPINVRLISKRAQELGIKVLIGGAGGDDLFSGYRRHLAISLDNKIEKIPNVLLKSFVKILSFFPSKFPLIRRLKKLSRDWGKGQDKRLLGFFNWLPNDSFIHELFKKDITKIDQYDYFNKILNDGVDRSSLQKMLRLEQTTFLIDHNLNYTDKMSMIEGVEARVPFLDFELVEFSHQIPDDLKLKNGVTKYILKKVAERYLPKDIIYRNKTGFGAPVRDMIDNDLKLILNKYLNKNRINKQGIFNYETINEMIKEHSSGKEDYGFNILSLVAIQSWLNQFPWKN